MNRVRGLYLPAVFIVFILLTSCSPPGSHCVVIVEVHPLLPTCGLLPLIVYFPSCRGLAAALQFVPHSTKQVLWYPQPLCFLPLVHLPHLIILIFPSTFLPASASKTTNLTSAKPQPFHPIFFRFLLFTAVHFHLPAFISLSGNWNWNVIEKNKKGRKEKGYERVKNISERSSFAFTWSNLS